MLKNKLKMAIVLFLTVILVSGICFATEQPEPREGDVATISETAIEETEDVENTEDESINSDSTAWVQNDLFICEDTVVVDNIVDGNAFIIGKDVTISGEVGGDVFVIADKLTVEEGYVYSSIFACANEINVNGVIYDIYALCNNFTLSEDGFVYRDLKVAGNTINISGKVKRNAFLTATSYNITETALIGGNLEYSANEDITIPDDIVTGEVNRKDVKVEEESDNNVVSIILSYVSDLVKTLVYTFVVVLLLLWLAPKFVDRLGKMSLSKDFASLGIGLAAIAVTIIGGIILLITIIGIPLVVSTALLLAILIAISFSITSIFFGNLFAKLLKLEGKVKFVLITLASALVLWVICQIPFIGGLASFLISLFGIGATIINVVSKKDVTVKEEAK